MIPFILFILVPLVELALLIKVGELIGIGATIVLVIATAVIGVSLLKRQGLAALGRARASVEAGEFPVESVVDGACLLVAGAFLLTPGLLTDTVGFSLLIPAIRRAIAQWLFNKFGFPGQGSGTSPGADAGNGPRQDGATPSRGPVIEGEFVDIEEEATRETTTPSSGRNGAPSPWRK